MRNAEIVRLVVNDGCTAAEVARSFGITRERVRQLLVAAGVKRALPAGMDLRRETMLNKLLALGLRLRRTPTGAEIDAAEDTPSASSYARAFGSLVAAQRAAGLVPYRVRRRAG